MTVVTKKADTILPLKTPYYKDNTGVWVRGRQLLFKVAGAWVTIHISIDDVTVTLASNTTNVNAQNLFSSDDWNNPLKRKRVVIPGGIIVGSLVPTNPALRTGNAWGGELVFDVFGQVQGAAGAANGGAGGLAIYCDVEGAIINYSGSILGGGGGGGIGGQGGVAGNGSYTAQDGPLYQTDVYRWRVGTTSNASVGTNIRWAGGDVFDANSGDYRNVTSRASGNITYYRGSQVTVINSQIYYQIYRQYAATMAGAAGGAGGTGGRGQGYTFASALGLNGTVGGSNGGNSGTSGTGGKGGDGGGWGASGTPGTAGTAGSTGNATGGGSGAAGGAAGAGGAAISGAARTLNNLGGTISGTI